MKNKRTTVLALALALALLLSLALPAGAVVAAGGDYMLFLGGEKITDETLEGEGWTWAPADRVLTLKDYDNNNAVYTISDDAANGFVTAALYYQSEAPLTVLLEGESFLSADTEATGDASFYCCGVYADTPLLTFKSTAPEEPGILNAIGGPAEDTSAGLFDRGELKVEDATLNLTGAVAEEISCGLCAMKNVLLQNVRIRAHSEASDLSVGVSAKMDMILSENAWLIADSGAAESMSVGIDVKGALSAAASGLVGRADVAENSYGIIVCKGMTLKSVIMSGNSAEAEDSSFGVFCGNGPITAEESYLSGIGDTAGHLSGGIYISKADDTEAGESGKSAKIVAGNGTRLQGIAAAGSDSRGISCADLTVEGGSAVGGYSIDGGENCFGIVANGDILVSGNSGLKAMVNGAEETEGSERRPSVAVGIACNGSFTAVDGVITQNNEEMPYTISEVDAADHTCAIAVQNVFRAEDVVIIAQAETAADMNTGCAISCESAEICGSHVMVTATVTEGTAFKTRVMAKEDNAISEDLCVYYEDGRTTPEAVSTFFEKQAAGEEMPLVAFQSNVTVHFDAAGGIFTDGSASPKTMTVPVFSFLSNAAENVRVVRSGYDFVGWTTENGTAPIEEEDAYLITDDVTFRAVWKLTAPAPYYPDDSGSGTAAKPTEEKKDPLSAFSDLDPMAWYADAVRWALEQGYMEGVDGFFGPDEIVRRALAVSALWKMEGSPVVDYAMDFMDEKAPAWYTEALRWAAAEGVIKGYEDGTVRADSPITREELATMLYRYVCLKGFGFDGALWYFPLTFADAAEVCDWADEAVHWMVLQNVLKGRGGNLLVPDGMVTRAELAAMLQRLSYAIK